MRATVIAFLVIAAGLGSSARARADDDVDAGWRLYLEADFDGALASFDRAERGALDRAELVSLLEGRAQVYFALGAAELDATLVALASLAPSHRLAPESPPELSERFAATRARVAGGLTLDVQATREPGTLRLVATVLADPAGLARRVRIAARWSGREREALDEPLILGVTEQDTVAYWAEVVGPAGAIVATFAEASRPALSHGAGSDDETWLWVGIGGGAALVLTAVLVGVFVGTATPPLTQPSVPVLPAP